MWSLDAVHAALAPLFGDAGPAGADGAGPDGAGPAPAGFACEDTIALASETIGFSRMKQRDVVTMTDAEVAALLGRPRARSSWPRSTRTARRIW